MSLDQHEAPPRGAAWTEAEPSSRRLFVRVAAAAAGCTYAGMIAYPVYRYLDSPVEKAAAEGSVSEVKLPGAQKLPPGSAMIFKFGFSPALLIHNSNGEWSALSAVCTHLGCTVKYEPEQERIYCACHGGTYDPVTGANRSGPPPRPLTKFQVAVAEDGITVSKGGA